PTSDPKGICSAVIRKRKRRRTAERFDSGEGSQLRKEPLKELLLALRLGIFAARQDKIGRHHARWIESWIGRTQVGVTLNEQGGAGEEEKRKRHLRDNKQAAQAV